MKMFITMISLVLAVAFSPLAATPAHAQAPGAYAADIPLVIIRFNQRKVNFERALYNATSRALATKPDVVFDVVSYVPPSCTQDRADSNMQQVVYSMRKMGVPADRMNVEKQPSSEVNSNEIHIFVR